jgi:hypothetical protein
VHEHLDHLAWLGIDVVWLTLFYPSPLADHGYGIADHCQVVRVGNGVIEGIRTPGLRDHNPTL